MNDTGMTKHDHVLIGLVFSLQSQAMMLMGKVQNPATGTMEIDLEQAGGLIDILDMLKTKCRHDTPEEILKMVDGAVMDLQLNYMDEVKKSKDAEDTTEETVDETATDTATETDGAEG
jgi:hypothetical protein